MNLTFLKRLRPLHLFSGILLYAMGVGISDYLGGTLDVQRYLLGQIWVTSLQLGFYLLGDYLGRPLDVGLINRPPFIEAEEGQPELHGKDLFLFTSLIFLSITAAVTFFLEYHHALNLSAAFLMLAMVLGYLVRAFPAISSLRYGFEEFLSSLQMVVIIPGLAFIFQEGMYHRFLGLVAFPLFTLHVAMLLVFQFPTYASDLARRRKSALTRMGWKNGIFLHNLLVIVAFLVLGVSLFLGFPPRSVYPSFLALPFGLFQVWYMVKLRLGAPTRWQLLTLTAVILFLLPTYLLTYSFWTQ